MSLYRSTTKATLLWEEDGWHKREEAERVAAEKKEECSERMGSLVRREENTTMQSESRKKNSAINVRRQHEYRERNNANVRQCFASFDDSL